MAEPSLAMKKKPTLLTISPLGTHTHTLIMLHGRGSNADRFALDDSLPEKPGLLQAQTSSGSTLPQRFPGFKFIFPTAPARRCSARKRTAMNIWFDSASFEDPFLREELHIEGIQANFELVGEIVRREVALLGSKYVFLGGLSEGCAMALLVLLGLEIGGQSLGGFVGMSGWLLFQNDIEGVLQDDREGGEESDIMFESPPEEEAEEDRDGQPDAEERDDLFKVANFIREVVLEVAACAKENLVCQFTPVFLGHGDDDAVVPLELGERMMETLRSMSLDVTWKVYSGQGHWFKSPDEIDDIAQFFERVV